MSSILSALRRLEDDKRPNQEPALRDSVVLPPTRRTRSRMWALPTLGALVAFVVIAAALGLRTVFSPEAPHPAAEATSAVRSLRPAVVYAAGPAAPTPGAPRADTTATSAARAPVSSVTSAARAPTSSVSARNPVVAAAAPAPRSAPAARRTPVAAIEAPPDPSRSAASSSKPSAAASPSWERTRSAAPTPTPVSAEPPATPATSAATSGPTAPKAAAPVGVERILWHPVADKRRAWVHVAGATAPQEVREGEAVGNYEVEAIDAGSILFRAGDIEIRHKLGAR